MDNLIVSNSGGGRTVRHVGLDTLKAICAFLVVCIHAKTNLIIGEYIIVIGRTAVPIFLMITGYFYHLSSETQKKFQIAHIFRLYLIAQSIYILYEILLAVVIPARKISDYLSWNRISLFFLVNETTPDSAHLWYLLALIYVLGFAYWFDRKIKIKIKYAICIILIIMSFIFGIYSNAIFGVVMPELVTRNYLFVGFPYFIIGEYVFDNRKAIETVLKTHYKLVAMITVLLMGATLCEHLIVSRFWINCEGNIYITTPLLAISIFVYFLFSDMQESIVSKIGEKNSGTIYVSHLMIYEVSSMVCNNLGLARVFSIGAPIMVFLLALLYSSTWNKVKHCIIIAYK